MIWLFIYIVIGLILAQCAAEFGGVSLKPIHYLVSALLWPAVLVKVWMS